MTRGALLNAFTPAQEVIDPLLFAGRSREVKEIADALQAVGSIPVVYGDRGLGKSSLAVQSQLIAMGDSKLLHNSNADAWVIPEASSFITFYVTCTDDIQNLEQLQLLVVHQLEDAEIVDVAGINESLVDRTTRRKLSFKMFELESTKKYTQRVSKLRQEELTPGERMRRELQLLHELTGQSSLIVVDEIDRLRDSSGLASFLRALSGATVKFMLVGVAETLADLHLDHPSIERSLVPIQLQRMNSGELADIVDRALGSLRSQGLDYKFEPDARTRLVRMAAGFPWFIHVIGQAALAMAAERNSNVVTGDLLSQATRGLVKNRFAQHFKDSYQRAVRDSHPREIVLRALAAWKSTDIPTSSVYPICRQLGVTNPAVYRGHLTSPEYGEPLVAPQFQARGLLRFRNAMFKQYINLTGSLYSDVDRLVTEATRSW